MKILYIADDGTNFTDEDECLQYERVMKNSTMNNLIIGMDKDNGIIPYSDLDFLTEAYYIYAPTQEAIDTIIERFHYEGLDEGNFDKPGFYLWNEAALPNIETDCWIWADDCIITLTKFIHNLYNTREILKQEL